MVCVKCCCFFIWGKLLIHLQGLVPAINTRLPMHTGSGESLSQHKLASCHFAPCSVAPEALRRQLLSGGRRDRGVSDFWFIFFTCRKPGDIALRFSPIVLFVPALQGSVAGFQVLFFVQGSTGSQWVLANQRPPLAACFVLLDCLETLISYQARTKLSISNHASSKNVPWLLFSLWF